MKLELRRAQGKENNAEDHYVGGTCSRLQNQVQQATLKGDEHVGNNINMRSNLEEHRDNKVSLRAPSLRSNHGKHENHKNEDH